jgi:hypothetical protein
MIPAILIYLLKANIALSLFYLAYRLGLRRLTFYTLNRLFLMCGIVFSAIYPFIAVDDFINRHETLTGTVMVYIPDFSQWQAEAPSFNAWMLLVYAFWIGVGIMGIRLLVQLRSLWKLHRQSSTGKVSGTTVQILKEAINPFSFFNHIYINPSLHQPEELKAILFHETVHIKQWHTLDVMIGEINNVFYWFNPGAWLMKTAIRENLEFITDRYLISQGVDKVAYQYNLIKVSGIPSATAIANNFNLSHLKNRILMMNSKRSSRYHLVRYLVLGSLAGGLVLLLNYSKASGIIPTNLIPEPIKESITLLKPAADSTKPAPVVTVVRRDTSITNKGKQIPESKKPVYVVDGKVMSEAQFNKTISPNDIKSIDVLKGEKAGKLVEKYGKKAENGVLLIELKKEADKKAPLVEKVTGSTQTIKGEKQTTITIVSKRDTTTPEPVVVVRNGNYKISLSTLSKKSLVMVNGQPITDDQIKFLDTHTDKIKSISVLKSDGAKAIYGPRAENGVVLIATSDNPNVELVVPGHPKMEMVADTIKY